MKLKFNISCLLLLLFAFVHSNLVFAQGNQGNDGKINKAISVSEIPSLVFTYWQHKSIMDARQTKGVVRAPTQSELDAMDNEDEFVPDAGKRDIELGGILFTKENSWIIWLNGQRVTPDAVPKEVLDLRVFKDYIEIKWLDDYTNQVFPIRIRTHQRFNMDSRIFLPG